LGETPEVYSLDAVPNRTSRPTYLLRESYRIGKKVRKRTLANLSALTDEQIGAIRAVLAGVAVRPVEELFEVVRSRPRASSPRGICAKERLHFTTCPRATSRARTARSPASGTTATARRTSSRSTMGF
jgi:hypothetical protein